jgi:membrane-associated phospholipid phosphatase
VLAAGGGPAGRRAAVAGLTAVGVTSTAVNLGAKAATGRPRPDRDRLGLPPGRVVPMPRSRSFPSGHSASGFAFPSAASRELPWLGGPLRLAATAVACSRVHTGVHYPGDAVAGALLGSSLAPAAAPLAAALRRRSWR